MARSEKSKEYAKDRARSWVFIVYPESAPADWRDKLDETHLQWVESPLHDKDIDGDGEVKKAHWHVMLMFDAVKHFDQVKELTDELGAPNPLRCLSAKGTVRYMAHLDNPEKHQYSTSGIIAHGGADIAELLRPTSAGRYESIREMINYIERENVVEFIVLLKYASENRYDDWFPLLCDNSAYIIGEAIKSNRNRWYRHA